MIPTLPPALVLLLLLAASLAAAADGAARPTILAGFDPLLRGTRDPGLLGVDRLVMRDHLESLGIEPARDDTLPSYSVRMRRLMDRGSGMDWRREVTLAEPSGPLGIETVFTYPEFIFLSQTPRNLPGGFVYYPPREIDSPDVRVFVDDVLRARDRRLAVHNVETRFAALDVFNQSGAGQQAAGLINLTIPIKLPHTLEKIIGRGEKTNIKISGREHIALTGESTVSNKFVPTERRRSQSLFPALDMEQQLQINLSGQIGEKIKLEVDHNSEAIGPDATKIRLSYEGTEDEIIRTIETGDVGLTLPGSQLLGYSSNKSGLFGLKVTGQFGPADFTVVTTKQKAESASRSFNSSGGTQTEHAISAYQYLNNRFFRLDLPPDDVVGYVSPDAPGRHRITQHINLNSVQVFRFVTGLQQDGDIRNVVAVPDTTGLWDSADPGYVNSVIAAEPDGLQYAELWRPVDFEVIRDQDDNLVAIDLLREYDYYDVLAVIYQVVDDAGNGLWWVGDRPGIDDDNRIANDQGDLYYRMKLLKPRDPEYHTWQYVLRNIYPLGGTNINIESFDLRIETTAQTNYPSQDLDFQGHGSGLDWIRIFGLDKINQQGTPGHDGIVDKTDPYLFDFNKGLLKFPLNVPEPFNASDALYTAWADTDAVFTLGENPTSTLQKIPQIYSMSTTPSQLTQYNQYRFVATHSAASSSFNLGVSNIEEGSETVTLDGRQLVAGQDYEIDYNFGEVTLKGDAAAQVSADSQISVTYQYAPFLGGGNSSLMGMNVGIDLGGDSHVSTTLLYQSSSVVGHKAKLGEEPSRTLVGNVNGQMTVRPRLLTGIANLLSRHDSSRESTVQLSGEMAMSVPNPNTFNEVYVEDYEGIDSSDLLPINRLAWNRPSAPVQGEGYDPPPGDPYAYMVGRDYSPANRLDTRWYLPRNVTQRHNLNPDLREQEAREAQQVLQIHMTTDGQDWQADNWGGVERGLGRNGVDLTKTQFLEFWVNDFRSPVLGNTPNGTLHFDFGFISEDGYWPVVDGSPQIGTYQREDGVLGDPPDGIWEAREDVGLLGFTRDSDGNPVSNDPYDAEYNSDANPYPHINGTGGNYRDDTEDLDGDSVFETKNGYFTISVDLADSALVDVLRDYPASTVGDNIENHLAWRKYRVRIGDRLPVVPPGGTTPQMSTITHMRIWFESNDPQPGVTTRDIQLTDIKFVGTRWEREGVRRIPGNGSTDETLLTAADLLPGEVFSLGEVNNKENSDYIAHPPPIDVYVQDNIPEKESSLVLDYQELAPQHMIRASRVISPQGEDFTRYKRLVWYLYNPDPDQADMDLFYRVGADTLNYYEINYRFDESRGARTGWRTISLSLAELSNAKLAPRDATTGWITTRVPDADADRDYRVRVVGSPDLRRVKRLYLGVRNGDRSDPSTGYFYFDDLRLKQVKRETGFAERIAASVNMADIIKTDFDWSRRDAEFHGLDSDVGQGFTNDSWNLSTNFRVDDFVPLLGFKVPVSFGKQNAVQKPKYLTNSDIEILNEALRDSESTRNQRDNFSVRVQHTPSKYAVLRYLVDPWAFSLNGSRTNDRSPLALQSSRNLRGSLTYDLRISGRYRLGNYPVFDKIPIIKGVGLLPTKISLSSQLAKNVSNTSNYNAISDDYEARPTQYTRSSNMSGAVSYQPLEIANIDVTVHSQRDPFRKQDLFGVNIGKENIYDQQVQIGFQLPHRLQFSRSPLLMPAIAILKGARSLKPSLNYNGSYSDNHSPTIRQAGDPPGVSNVQSSGTWTLRFSLPIDTAVDKLFPERVEMSRQQQQALINTVKKQEQRTGGQTGEEEFDDPRLKDPNLSEEEKEAIRDELRLKRAQQEMKDEAERKRQRGEGAPADTTATAAADTTAGGGRRLRLPNPMKPLLSVLRGTQPLQINYTRQRQGGYARLIDNTTFWYRVGFFNELPSADSLYVSHGMNTQRNLTLSTTSKLNRYASVDVNFSQQRAASQQSDQLSRSYSQDWPDVRLSLTGLEKLGVLGGGGNTGLFRTAGLQLNYKYSKNVQNYTSAVYNPRYSMQISPRLNFTFQSGMSAALNLGRNRDRSENNGSLTQTTRTSIALQLRHQFRAERLLVRLGLYKPGAVPTINMDLDLSYSRDITDRWFAASSRSGDPDQSTGTSRISFNPRFSYQISRNLSGALRLIYSRDKNFERDEITQRFGLGLEATFVF